MSNFFELTANQRYAEYSGKTDADFRKIAWNVVCVGNPLPPLSEWEVPLLTQYLGDPRKPRKPRKTGDAASVGLPKLIISEKSVDALKDILDKHALLYPVRLDDVSDSYYLVKAATILNCLDEKQSNVHRRKGIIQSVDEWVFKEDCIGDADLFALCYDESVCYVSNRFKDRVVNAGLKGFAFKTRFWDPKPFVT